MGSVYVERRPNTGSDAVSWDIAHHLFARQLQGTVVILSNNPTGLLSALRKQWLRVARKVQNERSSTLDATLILELTKMIGHMQNMAFTAKSPYDEPGADVYVMDNSQLTEVPFGCHTFYVADAVEDEWLTAIQEAMPYGGLVVVYR
jgi:hypothetical protein